MRNGSEIAAFIVVLAFLAGTVSAQYGGYGTSSIAISPGSASVPAGQSTNASYTVSLASGSTWGTNVNVVDASSLSSHGITVTLSKTYAEPTFTGTMTVKVGSTTAPGTYNVTLNATGDDPSASPATFALTVTPTHSISTTTTATINPTGSSKQSMVLIGKGFAEINASSDYYTTITINNTFLKMNVVVNRGTYALINGSRVPDYNFSVLLFQVSNVGVPNANYSPAGLAFAFAVNGKVNETIALVNASGAHDAPIITVYAPDNWTTWTYLGGSFNGTNYNGGSFAFPNTWKHVNSTVMQNTEFFAPVPWVFLVSKPVTPTTTAVQTTVVQTTAPTTAATTSVPYSSSLGYEYAAVAIIVIVIIVAVAYLATRKKA